MKTQQTNFKNIRSLIFSAILSLPLVITSCGEDDGDGGDSSCTLEGLETNQQDLVLGLLSGDCGDQSQVWNYVSATSEGETKTWDNFSLTLSLNSSAVNGKAAILYTATLPTAIQSDPGFQRVWPSTGAVTIDAITASGATITRYNADGTPDSNVESFTVTLGSDNRLTISFTVKPEEATRVLGTPTGAWAFVLERAS